MANVTLSLPADVYRRMKKHREVRWSEVVRRAIVEYLENLEGRSRSTGQLLSIVEKDGVDLSSVSLEQAEAYCKKTRALEWQRTSTTPATS
jgi:hypothetical protein